MNASRELKRAFGAARRRGLGEDEAKKLAIVDLLATLGLAVLPEEGLRASAACLSLLGPARSSWRAWRVPSVG